MDHLLSLAIKVPNFS